MIGSENGAPSLSTFGVVPMKIKTKQISFAAIAVLVSLGQTRAADYESTILADNPIGYWRLGEQNGTALFDSTANGLNGQYLGVVAIGSPGALQNDSDTSVDFDGTSGYGFIADSPLFNSIENNATFEAWVNPDHLNGIDQILSTRSFGGVGGFGLWRNGGAVGFSRWGVTGGGSQTSNDILTAGEWQHVVVVLDSSNSTKYYLNGEFVEVDPSTAGPIITNVRPLHIGRLAFTFSSFQFWDGRIDEVAIYDRELSANEIREHYLAATIPEPTTLTLAALGLFGFVARGRRRRTR